MDNARNRLRQFVAELRELSPAESRLTPELVEFVTRTLEIRQDPNAHSRIDLAAGGYVDAIEYSRRARVEFDCARTFGQYDPYWMRDQFKVIKRGSFAFPAERQNCHVARKCFQEMCLCCRLGGRADDGYSLVCRFEAIADRAVADQSRVLGLL
jgi:hypothetical protein